MLSPERVALIQEAKRLFGKVSPVGTKTCLRDCFTIADPSETKGNKRKLVLWFNSIDDSTHILSMEI